MLVEDIMTKKEDLKILQHMATVREAIKLMSKAKIKSVIVIVYKDNYVAGKILQPNSKNVC